MSNKRLKSNIKRINLDTKSKKQAENVLIQQYEKVGRKLPSKLLTGTATKSDMKRYKQTLINTLDRRIAKDELKSNSIQSNLRILNDLQSKRERVIDSKLNGYDEDFKKGFKSGKVAVLGRGITFSIHTTRNYTENQILKLAKNNKIKPLKAIKNEIKAIKEDIKNLNSADNTNYIFNQLKEFMELQGFSLTESNKKKILNRLKKIDWLGSQKLMATFNSKLEKKFYEIYKDGLAQENNDDLLQSIFNDINKASKDKISMYARLIE